jgi:hypothetical protein
MNAAMRRPLALTTLALAASLALPSSAAAPFWAGRVQAPRLVDVHATARAVIAQVGAKSARVHLVPAGVTQTNDGDRFVSFTQEHLGLPLVGAGVTVRLNARGEALLVSERTTQSLPTSAVARVSAREAVRAATRLSGLGESHAAPKLVFRFIDEDDVRLVYELRLAGRFPEMIAPRALVDATTGEVLEVRDLAVRARANTYETNPLKSTLAMRDLALAPSSTKLENDVLDSYNCIDDKRVASVDFGFGGPTPVHVCSMLKTAEANSAGDFTAAPVDVASDPARDSDDFSEVTMYYHSAKAYDFFRKLRGEPAAQVVASKPLRTVSNLRIPAGISSGNFGQIGDPNIPLEPFQNAFFSPGGEGDIFSTLYGFSGGSMWFGQGPVHDYSYDGDVVYHEFTHGVVDGTLQLEAWVRDAQGAIDAPGAMNEGLADYFAAVISGDPDVGEYASKDIDPSMNVIRTLANNDRCPEDVGGEVHYDSTFWTGGLWSARMTLPEASRTVYDRAIYKTMLANPGRGSLSFEDLTNLILATLATDLPAGKAALETALAARGAFPACDRTRTFTGTTLRGPTGLGGFFMAPGRSDLAAFRPVAPGVMTFKYDLPAYAKDVTFSFAVRAGGGGGGFGSQGTPFTPVLYGRFDEKIAWEKSGANLVATGATAATTTKVGSNLTATFVVPDGAKTLYVQIANSGQQSGMYGSVSFAATVGEAPPAPEAAPAEEKVEGGCGCAVAGRPERSVGSLLGAFVIALGAVLRGRKRTR